MRAFVTGSTGFIGSHLAKRLVSDGWELTLLVRDTRKVDKAISAHVNLVVADLRDRPSLANAVKGTDVIFNLAGALPHHKLTEREYWDINVGGTENLLASSPKKLKRFVHVSTVGIYGSTNRRIISESSPLHLTDAYSQSKAQAEKRVNYYHKDCGIPSVIIRPTIGYGPGDTRPGFLELFRMVSKSVYIPVGNGENYFHTVYVGNLIDALILAVSKKNATGGDFIIGDEPCPKMNDILLAIAEATGKRLPPVRIPTPAALLVGHIFDLVQKFNLPAPLTTRRVNFITQNRKYRIDKAKKVLGYRANVGLKEGVRRTFQWYKQNGFL